MIQNFKLFHKLTLIARLEFVRMAAALAESGQSNLIVTPVDKCIFCGIIKENNGEKIIYQDDEVVAFSDIKPAAKFHFLIVPKKHISDAKKLDAADKPLVEKLILVGKKVLEQQKADLTDTRFGFHWPPFHTISHLHLHAISPTRDMNFISRMIFRPDSYWFVPPDYVLSRL
ncbi:adenosine 5'-monophosphoramidase HINT3-like [Lycorma delicatula]|uniref:adenosine 5'-monophosphoramidase HINT3-like n=1 Tax=Lycorma delicatula TaxID=130591 RepID=UPI003F510C87